METCLISGGAGFIGSWLCSDLLEKNYRVVCVDNLISGRKENISELLKNKNFVFAKSDVVKEKPARAADYVFHLASLASPVHYRQHPVETLLANSAGTLNMIETADNSGAKLLYASSSEVYGDPKEHPQKETYWGHVNPIGERSCYDEGKRFSEALITSFPGLRYSIARIFNTYGPRMSKDDGRAVPNFINQAINNQPITVYGDGSQTRSFCYVSDMVEGLEKVMFSEKTKNDVFNVGNPNEITILRLAEIIMKLSGSKSRTVRNDLPKDDPIKRKPDISKIRKATDWSPKTGIEDGLSSTIEYFKALKFSKSF